MGKTLQTATDRGNRPTQAVVDRDLGAVIELNRAPSGAAMVRLLAVLAYMGANATKANQQVPIAELESLKRHATLKDWKRYCKEWTSCQIEIDDPENKIWSVGVLVNIAEVDYSAEGNIKVTIDMGGAYKRAFEKSDIWALIDIEQCSELRSKYATYLYMTLAGKWNLKHINEISLTMEELRNTLKIPKNKLKANKDVFQYALKPAVEEIGRVTSYNITWEPLKKRRLIKGATIRWEHKHPGVKAPSVTNTTQEAMSISVQGKRSEQTDPASGPTEHDADWPKIKAEQLEAHKINAAQWEMIRSDYLKWAREQGHQITPTASDRQLKDYLETKGFIATI